MFRAIFVLLAVFCHVARLQSTATCDLFTFPSTFKFGAGTAAYQIEGGWNEDGKSRSWWDWFTNNYPQYCNNATGNIACDSYHKYKEDVAAMKAIGLEFYRFSLSWSRILPKGFSYSVNQAGVDYYNNLIDELKAAGIEPLVTIYHWDTPMALEYLGTTWTSPKMVDQFVAFADLAFSLFGDRVKLWATINEPKSFCQGIPGYFLTYIFPELPMGTLEYLCGHHVLLAHAKTYRLYQEKYKSTQNGRISITLDLNYNMPLTNSTEDIEAAERRNLFEFGWFAHPLYYGDYPQIMKTVIANNSAKQNFTASRLPKFSCTEKLMIKGSYDLFMVNSYTGTQVTLKEYNNEPSYINDEQTSGTQPDHWLSTAVSNLKVYPEGIRYVLKYIKESYGNPEIMITENGYSDTTGNVNDTLRIEFIRETLGNIRLAICEDGVNVTRYTYWSLLDNLEWARGYGVKFGLVQIDFDSENRTRTLKRSAYYYKNVIQNRYINVTDSTE
ncbi:myrosinase 1-like [Anthonomus grandis grandis]|uniref:myrosinase 1-like n=1 Tax=Anthonomus grandis grandis TaxID=2921223 RepID=UPI00216643A8|nr:myrosinase 1-like [Anthonomus grandis grandis]